MAQIQAYRGGVGVDVSNLRPEGARVNNAANTSTGAWSWCDLFSYVTRMIGQNGRFGALMISMRIDHPDIHNFIKMKSDLNKVTGANVSIRITDEFMEAVERDGDFTLKFDFKDDGYEPIRKVIKAKRLWDDIIKYATGFAEPGLLMWDNITKTSPADIYTAEGMGTITTNPCSEIPLCAWDTCRLASINLTGFVNNAFHEGASCFDFVKFKETIKIGVRALDNIIELDKVPDNRIDDTARKGRRIGLGTHGLADCLLMLGVKYDTDQALERADEIYEYMVNAAYDCSVDLAIEKGPFPLWNAEKEIGHGFLSRLDQSVQDRMQKHGRRNVAMLTCAPTGTVSMVSNPNTESYGSWGVSSGIEPLFRTHYNRNIKFNNNEDSSRADFTDETGDSWKIHKVCHPQVLSYLKKSSDEVTDEELSNLPEMFVTSDKIDWKRRVDLQGTMQKWIDHAISSTINLPEETPESVVSTLYKHAWKRGLKGITVYVDKCREGVLTTGRIERRRGPQRPDSLDAIAHTIKVNGDSYNIYLGFLGDNIFEVFAVNKDGIKVGVDDGVKGKIIKRAPKHYDFESDNVVVKKINSHEDDEISAFTRLLTTALSHGVPLITISEQLHKSKGAIFKNVAKAINNVISQYTDDEVEVSEPCEKCGSLKTVLVKGCRKCKCGWSACG
jgi:ribonucleoside-diphosphate reductase alpha chain